MTRQRIDNRHEAEKLTEKYDKVRVRDVRPNDNVGPRPVHGVAGTGMDGIDVDLDQLLQTEKRLAALHDELTEQLTMAAELTTPMKDGSSPVTGSMRRRFNHLADVDGVRGALADYQHELVMVRQAILNTVRSYRRVDADAADLLRRHIAEIERETPA